MKKINSRTHFLLTTILYVFGFILLLEWLYPLSAITQERDIHLFIFYAALCFLILFLNFRVWLKLVLNGILLIFFLQWKYFSESFFSRGWLDQIIVELAFNMQMMMDREWAAITPLFRGLLLFLLIWLLSYLLHHWFAEVKRIFLFVLLTIVYLAVLDTFTMYDAGAAIVRTFIISLFAFALANLLKEAEKESITLSWNRHTPKRWMLPLLGMVCLSVLLGFLLPKLEPQWPDPVPFIERAVDETTNSGPEVQKVGYGEDDANLGGSFVQDDSPVFRAMVQEEQYWRGETKDVYTGKGWINSENDNERQAGSSVSLHMFSDRVMTERQDALIVMHPGAERGRIFYPYGIREIETSEEVEILLNQQTEGIQAQTGEELVNLSSYRVHYDQPFYSVEQMMQASEDDPESIQTRYTQLPETLPDRVRVLAEEITASSLTRYEKAKAVERYFSRSDYMYQTTGVPVPAEEEDYVDQFLFESRAGYCDNFSTSMVVMLRTLDIPARWVKGFTGGERVELGEEYDTYEITNENAHSWVEVYFPEVGWVPFEPTRGFTNLTEHYLEMEENALDDQEGEQPEEEIEDEEEEAEMEREADQQESAGASPVILNWKFIGGATAILAAIGLSLYILRFRLWKKWHHHRLTRKPDEKTFQDAYLFLLKLLAHKRTERANDETLREFAARVDSKYATDAMSKLTNYYEQILYQKEEAILPYEEITELWEAAVKKIAG